MDNAPDKFITVLTFTYPQEVAIVRGRLESEGIECFVKDEFMAQVYHFYSAAIGGVKLQVKESDLAKAVEILKEAGYIKDSDLQPPTFMTNLHRITAKIPLIGKLKLELRLIVMMFIFIGLIAGIAYLVMLLTNF